MQRNLLNYLSRFLLLATLFAGVNVWGQYNGTGTFNKITSLSDLTDGYYVIANNTTPAMSNVNAGSFFDISTISPSNNTITDPSSIIVWKIETNGNGRTIYNEASATYVSYTGSSNAAQAVSNVSGDAQRWTFGVASGLFTVANVGTPTRLLKYNPSAPRFACYTTGQNNLALYKMAVSGPSLSTSVTSLTNFGSINVGANSTSSSFTVSGSLLTANAVISAPSTDFQVSLNNTDFSSSVQIPFGTGTLTDVPVYVRFTPQTSGAKSGNVTVSSTGATSRTVGVSGTGVGPSAALSGTLNEATLNGASFTVTLTNDTFVQPLSTAGFTLNNAPSGVSIASVTYVNATTATIVLTYNDTDFDSNVTNMNVTIAANQLTSNAQLISGNITVTAVNESIASSGTLLFNNVCVNTTSDSNFTITGTVKAGTINLTAASGYTFSLTNGSNYTATLSIPVSAGSLNQIVYVRFAPTAAQAYNNSTTISGGSASSITKNFSGTGVNTTPTVTTPTSTNVLATTATLGGNITIAGCGALTERGIYYSTTNNFANGTGTKVSETGTFSTGVFTVPVTGLASGTTYYYRAFAVNGVGTAYSAQGTFTTQTVAVTLPYTQNFEGTVNEFYYFTYNGSGNTNAWAVGSATNNGGTKALYISNNGGTSNNYSNAPTYTGARLKVDLTNVTSATLAFDWKALGEAVNNIVYDFGEVYVTANGIEYLVSEDYEFRGSSTFATKQINLTPYVGGIIEVEFYWENDDAFNYNPPFAIDNISITIGSVPVVTTAAPTNVAHISATLGGNVINEGGENVTARGIVYNTTGSPTLSNNTVAMGAGTGSFQAQVTGFSDNTTYYVRAYATNAFGTDYGDVIQFTTTILPAPVATEETTLTTGGTGFTANWEAVEGAASYRLDVSTSSTFGTVTPTTVTEGFANGTVAPAGYTFTGLGTYGTAINAGAAAPSMAFNDTNDQMITPVFSGAITQFSFWAKGNATNATSALLVEGYNGSAWVTIQNVNNFTTSSGTTYTYSSATTPALPANITQLRFTYNKSSGNIGFDDLSVNYDATTLNVLPGYGNLTVNGTSQAVTGLTDGNTYYYRVRAVSANSTSLNSNTITAIAKTVFEWDGDAWSEATPPTAADVAVIAGDYNTGTDGIFESASLIINSGVFTVASGTTITVQNEIVNNAAASNFVIENEGNLIQVNNAANTGSATVYRFSNELFRLDYTFWSAPVEGQNLFDFSPGTQLSRFFVYGYNPSTGSNEFLSVNAADGYEDNDNSPNFIPGRSYLIRMPNALTNQMTGYPENAADYATGTAPSVFEGQFIGVPNNGDIILPFANDGGYNNVGNPYPSPILVEEFFTDNAANLEPGYGLFFWRKKNNADATSYAILSMDGYAANSGGLSTPENPEEYLYGGQQWESYYENTADNLWTIASGQGFFVRAASGSPGISFNNNMRSAPQAGQPFFRNAQDVPSEKSKLWFNLSAEGNGFSQTTLVYNPAATMGIDFGRDAKLFGNSGNMALFSYAADEMLAIQSRPAFEATDVVPLGYRVTAAGTYTLSLHRKEGIFEGEQKVYLRDNVLNITHNIKDGNYTFTTEAGTIAERFDIIYAIESLGTNDNVIDASAVVVYKQENVLKLSSANSDMQNITVYDLRGRVLYNAANINANKYSINNLHIQQQVILIEVTTDKGKITKKVIY